MSDQLVKIIAVVSGAAAMSCVAVGGIRRYSIAKAILDYPNERSSHSAPIPRGGGAGVVVVAIIGYVVANQPDGADWRIALAFLGIILTAITGWLDDRARLSVQPRLVMHIVAGISLVPLAYTVSPDSTFEVASLWVIATVSAINVINFVDGIDGMIGLQAVIFGAHLTLLGGIESDGGLLGLSILGAAIGFLFWNWHPAKVFLGDVGSGSLAVLSLVGALLVLRSSNRSLVTVFLPLLPIFLDASITLFQRRLKGERVTTAHRQHLYQRLANEGEWGHARVTVLYGVVAATGSLIAVTTPSSLTAATFQAYGVSLIGMGWILSRSLRRKAPS